ncbi:TonB-dependent siderophore receptor [Paracoccus kondratievae]
MTRILLIPSAASVRLTTALGAGILTMLACPALAQEAEDGAESTVVLDEVTITAAPGTETEGSGSWTTAWMRSATGLVLSQKETPQSTSAVTHAQMQDRNITTIAQTMEAATGITVQAYESDRINYYARGFYIDAYQYDGVPTPRNGAWTFGDNNPDMALYDHVEIVRGATGLMQGAGEPGASVNFIRKRPTSEFQNQTAVSLAYPKGAGSKPMSRGR